MFSWLQQDKLIHIAVIGDVILDEYWDGSVQRISPEAPVPVHHVHKVRHTAGGAANAARNISLAGGKTSLFSVCGDDEGAHILLGILKKDEVEISGVLLAKDRPTVKKTRITANNQQMLRVDWEKIHPITHDQQAELLAKLKKQKFNAILVSDYGKGALPKEFLQQIFAYAKLCQIPCIVDPKGKDFLRYQGCTVMTPNLKEAKEALNLDSDLDDDPTLMGEQLARRLQSQFQLQHILLTMGAKGMLFVPKDQKLCIYKKPKAREVFDVSGAGDTVAAILSLALGASSSYDEAIYLANLAAGIAVEKWGTQAIRLEELQDAWQRDQSTSEHNFSTQSKIIPREKIADFVANIKPSHKRIVFTNGCFDLLHAGHLSYLQKARSLGDILVVGVNTDESITRLKGKKRPIVPLKERMELLSGMACIDYVIPFAEDTPKQLIETIIPQVLVKGADYTVENIVGADVVLANGGEVKTIELVPGLSSSKLIEKIK